ncbi:MAG: hypothetical protein Q3963_09755, partial [Coriobacteriaceae bacterium]|nr:hypothetical protein [Coriobacteriaceae bacterium]
GYDICDGNTKEAAKLQSVLVTYTEANATAATTKSIQLSDEVLRNKALPVSVKTVTDSEDKSTYSVTILGTTYTLKEGTNFSISVQFIGTHTLSLGAGEVQATQPNPNPALPATDLPIAATRADEPGKLTEGTASRNEDGTYNASGTIKLPVGTSTTDIPVGTLKVIDSYGTGEASAPTLYAATNERITVIVKETANYALKNLVAWYKGASDTTWKSLLIKTIDPAIVDPNGGVAYIFNAPDGDIIIVPYFSKTEDASQLITTPSAQPAKTSAGKSIGAGAGFAMTVSDVEVEASIGANRTFTAGSLDIVANSYHEATTSGVAGTDPLSAASPSAGTAADGSATTTAGTNKTTKDVGLDAAVGLGILTDTVNASIGEGAQVTTTSGENGIYLGDGTYVNFNLVANQETKTLTKASAFAAGQNTAVGACAAVNVANSTVWAVVVCDVNVGVVV